MLRTLDLAFTAGHTLLILFNVVGWAVPRWRRANLAALLLTAFSWFGLGIFYGWGFCPLTEWHFRVLEALGVRDLPHSYIAWLVTRLTGREIAPSLLDPIVVVGFFVALVCSLVLNLRDRRIRVTGAARETVGR